MLKLLGDAICMTSKTAENRIEMSNSGFTLVELLVTILLMAMVTGIVVAFVGSSLRTYEIVDTQAQLQEESEITTDFIRNIAVEASRAGYFGPNAGDENDLTGTRLAGSEVLWFYAPDPNNTTNMLYHFIIFDADDNVLRYATVEGSSIGASAVISPVTLDVAGESAPLAAVGNALEDEAAPYHLLARHVYPDSIGNAMTYDCIRDSDNESNLLSFKINFKYHSSEDYPIELKVVARNL